MILKKHIPNLFTCANLFFGCLAIVFAIQGKPISYIACCVWAGAFFDFFDGLIARKLKVSGDFGKQLDSLADLITFGVTPFLTLFVLLNDQNTELAIFSILITVCSALRLAKFNIDDRQSTVFIGLPTPANALFFTSLPFLLERLKMELTPTVWFLLILSFSLLMVSNIPMMSLKVTQGKFLKHWKKILLIVVSISMVIFFQLAGISMIILLYIVFSILSLFIRSRHLSS